MISETRCTVCRSYLDCEDLFCSNCGTENPAGLDADGVGVDHQDSNFVRQQASVMSFRCDNCGASMSYDASAKTLRCPFCGGQKLTSRRDARTLKPSGVVPFVVERNQVEQMIRQWLARGFWKPGDASERSIISSVTQVYVPFWVFNATTETAWTADTSAVTSGARGNWRPIFGTRNGRYDGILVCASGILSVAEANEIAPFDLQRAIPPEQIDLLNVIVEEFRVTKRDSRNRAAAMVEQYEASQSQAGAPGTLRNLNVNVRIQNMTSTPILLPIWIMAYRYNKDTYRVLVNGQTGEVYGAAPFSYAKLTGIIIGVFANVLLCILVAAIAATVSQ